jgi:hypothetical protein
LHEGREYLLTATDHIHEFCFKVNDPPGLMAVVNLKLEVITPVTYVIIGLLLISL